MIRIDQLSKTFFAGTANEVAALKGISLTFNNSEYSVIIGSNGSGKSTFLNCIAGSVVADNGSIHFDTEDVTPLHDYQRSRYIARIFQNPLQGTAPDLSILENFRLAKLRTGVRKLSIGTGKEFSEAVKASIAQLGMGLESKINQPVGTLSGGQRQALTLLMAVMSDCKLLLLDEPTAALDPRSAELVLTLADQLIRKHNLCAILITHNMKDAVKYGDRLLVMQEGKIVEDIREKEQLQAGELLVWF